MINHFSVRTLVGGILSWLIISCQTATWVGNVACYPEGTDRESADFCLWINIQGGAGRAYVDRSQKTVHLSILDSDKDTLLEREYIVVAGDLHWYSTWDEPSNLQVIFLEHGDATAAEQAAGLPKKLPRMVFSLAFTRDDSTSSFIEAYDPAAADRNNRYYTRENKRHIIEIYFEDSPDNESQILEYIEGIADRHELAHETPQAGLTGLLTEYVTTDFSIEVHRYDSLRELGVTLEDYGRRKLSGEIAEELRGLSGVSRTRRFVSVNISSGSDLLESVLAVVADVAGRHALVEIDSGDTLYIKMFALQDLQISIYHSQRDGLVKISIEDLGWHDEFAEIEEGLRSELSSTGIIDVPGSI
jgi:hypothetical protein